MSVISTTEFTLGYLTLPVASAAGLLGSYLTRKLDWSGLILPSVTTCASSVRSSAEENVGLALAFAGVRGSQRKKRAQELLDRVGLADRLTHRPAELSGGEQQRVAIARALANRPRVLLADEPTGNLDSTRAHELLTLLRAMVTADGLTIIMVTHDHELARTFADRIVLMKDGKAVE